MFWLRSKEFPMAEFDTVAPESLRLRRPMNPVEVGGESGVASLQSSIGNSAVARMLQREAAPEEEEEIQAKHDSGLAQRQSLAQREGDEEEELMQAKHDTGIAQREGEEEEELQAKHDGLAQRDAGPEVGLAGGGLSDACRVGSTQPAARVLRSMTERAPPWKARWVLR